MTLTQTLSLASLFAGSVALAGCGSSTSNNPPGGDAGGVDTGAAGTSDSGTTDSGSQQDAGTPVGPSCMTSASCGAGEKCCVPLSASALSGMGNCGTGACSGIVVDCRSASACGTGQVCCGSLTGGGATCETSCPMSATSYQLCASATECPSGDTCSPATYNGMALPITILVCTAPDAGAPPIDGGPAPDAGTSDDASAGDAGAADATGD